MRQFIKDLLFSNLLQKLLAISFAFIIWFFAPTMDRQSLTEIQFFVPVTYINLPKNLEIVSRPLQSISISIEIAKSELQIVHPSLFQAVIDLEKAMPGTMEFSITNRSLKIPDHARIIQISPDSLELTFEEIIEKRLPIKPVFIGELATGFVLEKVMMIPEKVTVKGPISILTSIEQLETKAISIDNVDNDIDLLVQIAFPDRISAVEPKPPYYAAKLQVGSEPIERRYLNVPIGIVNQTYVTRINPRQFNVVLRGPRSILQNFERQDIQAFIDLKDYTPGTYKVDAPTVRLRPELQFQLSWPPIDIWIKKERID
jgi:YbbR domain-containing protein